MNTYLSRRARTALRLVIRLRFARRVKPTHVFPHFALIFAEQWVGFGRHRSSTLRGFSTAHGDQVQDASAVRTRARENRVLTKREGQKRRAREACQVSSLPPPRASPSSTEICSPNPTNTGGPAWGVSSRGRPTPIARSSWASACQLRASVSHGRPRIQRSARASNSPNDDYPQTGINGMHASSAYEKSLCQMPTRPSSTIVP